MICYSRCNRICPRWYFMFRFWGSGKMYIFDLFARCAFVCLLLCLCVCVMVSYSTCPVNDNALILFLLLYSATANKCWACFGPSGRTFGVLTLLVVQQTHKNVCMFVCVCHIFTWIYRKKIAFHVNIATKTRRVFVCVCLVYVCASSNALHAIAWATKRVINLSVRNVIQKSVIYSISTWNILYLLQGTIYSPYQPNNIKKQASRGLKSNANALNIKHVFTRNVNTINWFT